MIRALATLVLLIGTACGEDWNTPDLRIKYDSDTETALIGLPKSLDDVNNAGWVQYSAAPGVPSAYSALNMYCSPDDLVICVMLDDTGYIAGLQVAVNDMWMTDPAFSWSDQGYTQWEVTLANQTVNSYWVIREYFVSAETLATEPAARIAARDSSKLIQGDYVYVTGFDGILYSIPTNIDELTSSTSIYTKQACIAGMGIHYMWNMTTELPCTSKTIFPFFPLVYKNQLIGMGTYFFATYQAELTYFEAPTSTKARTIVPEGPECLFTITDQPGAVTVHLYFIRHPEMMTCDS